MYCHHTSSLAFVCLVNSACLHTLLFVTYFSQSQAHTQSCNIIGHLRTHSQSRNIIGYLCTHSQSRNIIGYLCTHSTSHNTIGQCLLYNLSHTAVSLVLYAVDKGLRGRNVLQSLLLILLRICSRSVCPIQHTAQGQRVYKLAGASKYGSRYQPKWEQEFPFIKCGIQDSVYSFYCKVWQRDISCRHQGIADLKRHEKTSSHAIRVRSMQGSSKLNEMGLTKHCLACLLSNWQLMSLATNMNHQNTSKQGK